MVEAKSVIFHSSSCIKNTLLKSAADVDTFLLFPKKKKNVEEM